MNTYNIPRNVKGEGRILMIFSTKALIYTFIGIGIGAIFYLIFSILQMGTIGFIIMGIFGLIGFAIGTFKMPDVANFSFTRKTGGENIDDVIKRAIKFKMQHKKIYLYSIEQTKTVTEEKGGKTNG